MREVWWNNGVATGLLRYKGKDMGRHRLVMNVETITCDALTKGAGLHRDTFTGKIADGSYYFDSMKSELVKRVSGKRMNTTRRDPLTLP